jgi:Tol biopolymer transport system component
LNSQGIVNLYEINVESGKVSGPLLPAASVNFNFVWSKDGKAIYYIQLEAAPSPTDIRVHDLETGRDDILYRPVDSRLRDLALSPDGAWLTVGSLPNDSPGQETNAVLIIPTGGGRARELFRAESGQSLNLFGWTPDGTHLIFNSMGALWRVAADGGPPQRLGPAIGRPYFHPDGKRVALGGGAQGGAEVWAMENYLPLRAAK